MSSLTQILKSKNFAANLLMAVINGRIAQFGGDAAAGRSAGLHGLDLRLTRRASANVVDDFADGDSQ